MLHLIPVTYGYNKNFSLRHLSNVFSSKVVDLPSGLEWTGGDLNPRPSACEADTVSVS